MTYRPSTPALRRQLRTAQGRASAAGSGRGEVERERDALAAAIARVRAECDAIESELGSQSDGNGERAAIARIRSALGEEQQPEQPLEGTDR
ncbi:hypothetical protein EYS09_22265 [Streptomyces kasugaensis]|uniref:Uncharacterized protein n=1 Tax=Streptomyces kasugaensis TaxID=1946 RepID=A0A4Q9HRD0_STRKA|nr:hypothetical protein [Streptomyces kasugaensis]TBO57538.1 hypothetical protein EYS09_22265 [Streptomyces kasugaensis]